MTFSGITVGRLDNLCAGFIACGEDVVMPQRYPDEFKRDVVAVARRGDLTVLGVATDFGVAEETVRRWMR